jgi:hypothetical protein
MLAILHLLGTFVANLFDHAGTVDVEYPVAAIGAPAPGAAAGGGMKMQRPSGGMMQMDKH